MSNGIVDKGIAVGEFMSDSARSVAGGVVSAARRVGFKRGAVALGIAAGGLGTMVLMRYLKARDVHAH